MHPTWKRLAFFTQIRQPYFVNAKTPDALHQLAVFDPITGDQNICER